MFDTDFNPVLRFMVCSDVHYKDEHTVERDRMALAIDRAYDLSESQAYSALDAVYVVGDFANSGSPAQMAAFRKHWMSILNRVPSGMCPLPRMNSAMTAKKVRFGG